MQLIRSWFPAFFAGSLALAALLTPIVQSRSKWAVLRRIRGWPGILPLRSV
jgi:hypothetical protein